MHRATMGLILLAVVSQAVAQQAVPDELLKRLKDGTVLVQASRGAASSSGSGFIVHVDAGGVLVASNAHTVMLYGKPADTIRLVFFSGTAAEKVIDAEVVCRDDEEDLSILRVKLDKPPAPIDLARQATLKETMPVLILGFPFGRELATGNRNPAMTINRGSVSSIRRDAYDQPAVIQLDGDLNPGNSGGPVVDEKGLLVGISVAKIVGTHIGLAIPAENLQSILAGRFQSVAIEEKSNSAGKAVLAMRVGLMDPLSKIRSVSLLVMESAQTQPDVPRDKTGRPGLLSARMAETAFKLAGDSATGEIQLASDKDRRKAYTYQLKLIDALKQVRYTAPRKIFVSAWGDGPAGGGVSDKNDWLAPDRSSADPNATAKPEAVDRSLAGKPVQLEGAVATPLKITSRDLVPNIVWSADGGSFFLLEARGLLHRVSASDLKISRTINLKAQAGWIEQSSAGLVVSCPSLDEYWVLDSKSLAVLRRIPVADGEAMTAAPASPMMCVTIKERADYRITLVDLAKGKVVRSQSLREIVDAAGKTFKKHAKSYAPSEVLRPTLTPDGKYLFFCSEQSLHRIAMKDDGLEYEEVGPPLVRGSLSRIEVSSDSAYVAVVSGEGNSNPGDHPEVGKCGTYIYRAGDLQSPLMSVRQGSSPLCLAFDKSAKLVCSQDADHALVLFRPNGTRAKQYAIPGAGLTGSIAVSPRSGRLVLLTDTNPFFVELPPTVAPEPPVSGQAP